MDNVGRDRKASPEQKCSARMSVLGQIFERKVSARPGGIFGLLRKGVSGHGDEDILNRWHAFLKICNVLMIKGCCLHSSGTCIEAVQGSWLTGIEENACSIFIHKKKLVVLTGQ